MADDEGQSMVTFVKSVNIKDVVYMVGDAWEDVPSSILCKSWFKLLNNNTPSSVNDPCSTNQSSDEPSCEDLLQQLDSSLTSEDIANWMAIDHDDPGYQLCH